MFVVCGRYAPVLTLIIVMVTLKRYSEHARVLIELIDVSIPCIQTHRPADNCSHCRDSAVFYDRHNKQASMWR